MSFQKTIVSALLVTLPGGSEGHVAGVDRDSVHPKLGPEVFLQEIAQLVSDGRCGKGVGD